MDPREWVVVQTLPLPCLQFPSLCKKSLSFCYLSCVFHMLSIWQNCFHFITTLFNSQSLLKVLKLLKNFYTTLWHLCKNLNWDKYNLYIIVIKFTFFLFVIKRKFGSHLMKVICEYDTKSKIWDTSFYHYFSFFPKLLKLLIAYWSIVINCILKQFVNYILKKALNSA